MNIPYAITKLKIMKLKFTHGVSKYSPIGKIIEAKQNTDEIDEILGLLEPEDKMIFIRPIIRECELCDGEGQIDGVKCQPCDGNGSMTEINIP